MRIRLTVVGGEALQRRLMLLNGKIHGKIVRAACRDASKIVQSATQTAARSVVGGSMGSLLARNLIVRKQKKRTPRFTYIMTVLVKPKVKEFLHYARGSRTFVRFMKAARKIGKTVGVSYIPAAIEYGHGRNKSKASRPFMRIGLAASEAQAAETLVRSIQDGIASEVNKSGAGQSYASSGL